MQVLVAGMHRSGTSIVTRLLNLAGCYVGSPEEMMQGMPDNPGGYWERNDICELSTAALNAAGVDWNTTLGDEIETLGPERRQEIVHSIRDVVQGLEKHRPWAVKDPRLSVLLPMWTPLLSDAVVVICHRHPLEVARSLRGRDGMPISIGIALWEVYTLAILQNTRTMPRVFVAHDELLRSPIKTAKTLVSSLREMGFSTIKMPTQNKIKNLIDDKLHRSKTTDSQAADYLGETQFRLLESLESENGLNDWSLENLTESSKDLIAFYREATTMGSERRVIGLAQVREILESFSAERNQASQSEQGELSGRLSQAYEDMEKLGSLLENQNAAKDRLAQELIQTHAEKGEIGLRLEAAGAEINNLQDKFEDLRQEKSDLDEEIQKSHDDRTGLGARLEQVHEEMQRLGALFEQTNAEKASVGEELRSLYGSNQEIGTKLEFATEENRKTLEKAQSLEAKSNELERELAKSREEGIRLTSTLGQLHSNMEVVGALLEKTADEKQELSTQLQETHVARAELGLRFDQINLASQELETDLEAARTAHAETTASLRKATTERDELSANLGKTEQRLQQTTSKFNMLNAWHQRLENTRAFRMYLSIHRLLGVIGPSPLDGAMGEENSKTDEDA